MFRLSFNIATIWGIPIRIHISFLLLMLYLWSRLQSTFSVMLAYAGFLALSIILHELGHSYFALRYGCKVRDITITFIGGAAQMARIPSRPREEIVMAAAGPAVSFMLGGLMLLGHFKLPMLDFAFTAPHSLLVQLLGSFSILNFFLGGFNLIPAFPMDGGRIFRALMVKRKGRLEATRLAARVGRWTAWAMGLYGYFGYNPHNWIMIAVAFFIHGAANQELLQVIAASRVDPRNGWPFGGNPAAVDQVIIGPAPYEKGPGSESDVYRGR